MINEVLDFWFSELSPKQWWQKDPALDATIAQRFGDVHRQAVACELDGWRSSERGSLAEIIVLDQFSRNIFRDTPAAFAADSMALTLAQVAIDKNVDTALPESQRAFLYMPFMHSESRLIHQRAVTLFTSLGNENTLEFEHRHKAIIDQFGRYPHRNAILGRPSTPDELTFLQQPGAGF